jgi:hypothetical protein
MFVRQAVGVLEISVFMIQLLFDNNLIHKLHELFTEQIEVT